MFTKSDELTELASALHQAQAIIAPAIKDRKNPHFKSDYATLGSVWDACRAALKDHGLSVAQMPCDAGEGRIGLTTLLLHTSGQYISSTAVAPLAKNDPQGVGSALTYLRRYGLAAMLGIVADDDDDGNAASAPPRPRPQQAPVQPARPAPPATSAAAAWRPAAESKLNALWAREEHFAERVARLENVDIDLLLSDQVADMHKFNSPDLTREQALKLYDVGAQRLKLLRERAERPVLEAAA